MPGPEKGGPGEAGHELLLVADKHVIAILPDACKLACRYAIDVDMSPGSNDVGAEDVTGRISAVNFDLPHAPAYWPQIYNDAQPHAIIHPDQYEFPVPFVMPRLCLQHANATGTGGLSPLNMCKNEVCKCLRKAVGSDLVDGR